MANTISIIGGGINGITTALTLQLLGFDTMCYAEYLVDEETETDPRFASQYPAASVIPHSVRSEQLHVLFPDSLQIFKTLFNNKFVGLAKHRHFEIFEMPVETPEYTSFLDNVMPVDDLPAIEIPSRKNVQKLYGWAFDCLMAEWPTYIHQLYQLYERAGGILQRKKITRNNISKLPGEVIINCTGIWSSQLFEDSAKPKIVRGHILHALKKTKITDSRGRICSYNYTPDLSVYATPDGECCDVYFYPVNNHWVLGGSRETGVLKNDTWSGGENKNTINMNGKLIPRQIIEVNAEILQHTFQADLNINGRLKSMIGYRFERDDTVNGLRLDSSEEFDKKIIHNYGHGGAGVTLSWGCALQVAHLLRMETNGPVSDTNSSFGLVNELQTMLKNHI